MEQRRQKNPDKVRPYYRDYYRKHKEKFREYHFVHMHSFEDLIEMIISIILIHVAKMPTYIVLIDWTDQGIRNVKDTIKK